MMSRDVKFRQPRIANGKFNHWHYWGYVDDNKGHFVAPLPPNTGGDSYQYTDLKDKNGVEIYKNAIYKDADGIISIVQMAVDGWALFPIKKGTPVRNLFWQNVCDKTKGEVIGDTHQTPELMKNNNDC